MANVKVHKCLQYWQCFGMVFLSSFQLHHIIEDECKMELKRTKRMKRCLLSVSDHIWQNTAIPSSSKVSLCDYKHLYRLCEKWPEFHRSILQQHTATIFSVLCRTNRSFNCSFTSSSPTTVITIIYAHKQLHFNQHNGNKIIAHK